MPGDVVEDRYELEQLVGSGGMSTVYRAHDRVLERSVALKVLHERLISQKDITDRFTREAKLVAALQHHNIVGVIDRGDHDGRPFIVFEYIAGENLKQLVNRTGPLPVERALELTIEVAQGLAYAHKEGFVHRDVKPQNVLLNGNGEAKVTDFGIARPLEVKEGETQTGTVLGTCDYISPEQAQGQHVDEHTDVYSLGIVLYELLTGHVPFTGDNFVAVAMQHINAEAPPVTLSRPEVPARVEAAVEKALAKDPGRRFHTMAEFRDELQGALTELQSGMDTGATGILPAPPPARSRPKQRRGRRPRNWRPFLLAALVVVPIAAIALVLLLAGGGGGGGGGSGPIDLTALRSYDPYGNNLTEMPGLVHYATDGSVATAWSTETYSDPNGSLFGKPGVGIVLDAGSAVTAHQITVTSDTPGYTALIRASSSPDGGFADDSASQVAGSKTTFRLNGVNARYYLVWITNRGSSPAVHINEVSAS